MSTFANLDKKFDVPVETQSTSLAVIPSEEETILLAEIEEENNLLQQMEGDVEIARQSLHSVLGKGQEALDMLMGVAEESEQPRVYEVLSQMLRTVAETAKDLVALQKQKKEISGRKILAPGAITNKQTNIIFSGTTSDLMKQLRSIDEEMKVVEAEIIHE